MALKQNAQITLTARDKTKLAFRSINTGLGRMQKAVMGLTKLMPALAVGFSAVALVQFTKNAFKTADAIAKTADKIGLTTKSLQELRFGAKLSGVETNTLDMAMQRFSRRLGEAQQGTGELKQTLIDYGIAVRNVDGSSRSVDAVLNDFANTIQNAESDTERLRIAFKGFDSEGASLVNMLKDGSIGLQAFRDEAEFLGVIIEDDLLRNAEETNNQFEIMTQMFSVKFKNAMLELSPVLMQIADSLIKIMTPTTEMEHLKKRQEMLVEVVAEYAERIQKLKTNFSFWTKAIEKNEFAHASYQAELIEVTKRIKELEAEQDEAKNSAKDLGDTIVVGTQKFADYNKQTDVMIKGWQTAMTPMQRFRTEFLFLNNVLENQTVKAMRSVEDAIIDITWRTKTASEAFREMAVSILQDMQRIMMRKFTGNIAQKGFDFLSDAIFGNLFTSSANASMAGNYSVGVGSAGLPFMANGGSVQGGKPYIVGERGAELFVPSSSGEIIPNNKMGGITIQNVINVSTGVSQTVRAEIANLMPQISSMTTEAVRDAQARGNLN